MPCPRSAAALSVVGAAAAAEARAVADLTNPTVISMPRHAKNSMVLSSDRFLMDQPRVTYPVTPSNLQQSSGGRGGSLLSIG
jgi:hypothetical protein